jgi:hypothetical protein
MLMACWEKLLINYDNLNAGQEPKKFLQKNVNHIFYIYSTIFVHWKPAWVPCIVCTDFWNMDRNKKVFIYLILYNYFVGCDNCLSCMGWKLCQHYYILIEFSCHVVMGENSTWDLKYSFSTRFFLTCHPLFSTYFLPTLIIVEREIKCLASW